MPYYSPDGEYSIASPVELPKEEECCCERLGVALGLLIFVDSVLSIMFGPNYIPGPEYAPGAGKVALALIIFCGTLYFYKRKRRFLNRRRKWVS